MSANSLTLIVIICHQILEHYIKITLTFINIYKAVQLNRLPL